MEEMGRVGGTGKGIKELRCAMHMYQLPTMKEVTMHCTNVGTKERRNDGRKEGKLSKRASMKQ